MTNPHYIILLLLTTNLFPFLPVSASHFNATNTHSLLPAKYLQKANEVASLLTWKSSLDLKSQKLLSSWVVGGSHCNWNGIHCNADESITGLNLTGYGLRARFLSSDSTSWSTIAGTMGYTAPEFAYTVEINCKCDVYSFGVVTLEMIMGKHPGDLITCLSSSSISTIDGMLFSDLLDPRVPTQKRYNAKQLVLVAKIAVSCINPNPHCRPSMEQVSMLLSKERDFPKFSPEITLSQLFGLEFQTS